MRTRVKICGFTCEEEAVYAAYAGVDAIGLVFYPPSPRHVHLDQAIRIVNALPAFTSVVALFVDEHENNIRYILDKVPVDCIQFHGDESPETCRAFGKRYIKAVRMTDKVNLKVLAEHYYDADALLVDAYHPDSKGGTGNPFDWSLLPNQCDLPIILAGGLDANNVQSAVATIKPYAVDVSSGVEIKKGIKDTQKIAAFMKAVYQGDQLTL